VLRPGPARVGYRNWIRPGTGAGDRGPSRFRLCVVLMSLLYRLLCGLLGAIVRRLGARELEIVVLRPWGTQMRSPANPWIHETLVSGCHALGGLDRVMQQHPVPTEMRTFWGWLGRAI
jgi:hypothetical protein